MDSSISAGRSFPEQQALFKKLANSQRPRAMFITCADSRIVPELITQSSPATCSSPATSATWCRPTGR